MHRHVSMDNFHIGNFLVAMILYLILCIFSFFFVIKVYLVIQRFHFGYRRTVNVRKTLVIILIISSLYLIQAIYSFFAIINKNIIDSWSNKCFKTDNPKYYIYVFWNLTITEIAPCFMIWMVFHITLKRNTSRLLPESAHINKDNTNSEPESSDSEEEY
ncbi:adenosine receptor [Anaeramoeba flamelloides]|uniref:Adenosine receptor n=1 Tax=Anaeramoeba flamelloides TaxID=1746091 RepID=A0AAV8ACH9_9EUKA|nr:adenosine receptor isoform a [Anaeramoeba flamelloides]KAJ6249600.1 adenosine receptor [Anaeramoeba flamelloides]